MKLLFLCPRWGSESYSASEFISRVQNAGYDGVEVGLSDGDAAADETAALAKETGLALVTQHWMTTNRDIDQHSELFEKRLLHAAGFQPLFINSHTGRDLFTLAENKQVFGVAERTAASTGIPIYHETHRGRCLHTPWRTAELLRAMPSLRLVLDMSHWCNVCETLLQDQDDIIEPLLPGPQVSDPRAPEWDNALKAHLKWWDKNIAAHRRSST